MGNNHQHYFGKDKRKIIVLGLQGAGKTTLINYIVSQKVNFNTQKTKNLNILDKKLQNLHVTFFDLGGSQRQRIFWKQQYQGTQGVIFVIDAQKFQTQKLSVIEQLTKLVKNISTDIPFCICLNKADKVGILGTKIKNQLQKEVSAIKKQVFLLSQRNFRIFEIDYSKKQEIKQAISWLLRQSKPI